MSDSLVEKLCELAKITREAAKELLMANNYNIDAALAALYDDPQMTRGVGGFETKKPKQNTWFAGGKQSAVAIEGPPDPEHYINQILENASKSEVKEASDRELSLYQNGFLLDNVFYPFSNRENLSLIAEISEGYLPPKLANGSTNVRVNKYLDQEYKDVFSAAGHTMAPNTVQVVANSEYLAPAQVIIDETRKTTMLSYQPTLGARIKAKFNLDNTVGQARAHFAYLSKDSRRFLLVPATSQQPIVDENMTLESAQLLNERVSPYYI